MVLCRAARTPYYESGVLRIVSILARIHLLHQKDHPTGVKDKRWTVSAYVPLFRFGVLGDTLEEARANAIDLDKLSLK
ncbi:hypothetical protein [Paenibacillus sp. FSL F4-0243]|uniref:hypothetical protein n=1 Tax=Paenibacillus sp. FSL F4-0243 TaxID=2954732 RepID=UPI0030DC1F95